MMDTTRLPTSISSSIRSSILATLFAAAAIGWTSISVRAAEPVTAEAKAGLDLYNSFGCYQCHGTYGQGGNAGPKIAPEPLPYEAFQIIVRRPVSKMPPYTDKVLSDDQLRQIHAYLSSVEKGPTASEIDLLDVTIQPKSD